MQKHHWLAIPISTFFPVEGVKLAYRCPPYLPPSFPFFLPPSLLTWAAVQEDDWFTLWITAFFPVEGVKLGDRKHARPGEGGKEGVVETWKEV